MIKAIYHGHQNTAGDLLCLAVSLLKKACHQSGEQLKKQRKRAAIQIVRTKKKALQLGYKQGKKEALSKHCQLLIKGHLSYQKIIQQANQDCLELALTVAEEIIATQLTAEPGWVAKRIERLLSSLLEQNGIKIKVSHTDYHQVSNELKDLALQRRIKIESCDSIEVGNAVLETVSGKIELSWQEQLSQLKEHLQSQLEKLTDTVKEDELNA